MIFFVLGVVCFVHKIDFFENLVKSDVSMERQLRLVPRPEIYFLRKFFYYAEFDVVMLIMVKRFFFGGNFQSGLGFSRGQIF